MIKEGWDTAESSPDIDNLILLAQIYGISLDNLLRPVETPPFWPEEEQPPDPELLYPQEPTLPSKKQTVKLTAFPYPVFVALAYLVLGFVFGKWHPGWLIFLTLPLYYWLAEMIDKKEK